MLNLDARVRVPKEVSSTTVEHGAILMNLNTGHYYALRDIGMRFWELIKDGGPLREAYRVLLDEYEVEPAQLEHDLLELLAELLKNGLVEIPPE